MSLPDLITMFVCTSLGLFAGWRVLDLKTAFGNFGRVLLPRRRKKKQVDAIADMVQWKKQRRLEDQREWQERYDLLDPPQLPEHERIRARAIGWRLDTSGVTQLISPTNSTVLEWTSHGWVPKKYDERVFADCMRAEWLMKNRGHIR